MKREEDEDRKKGLADARDNESLEERARSISVTRKVRSDSAATLTVPNVKYLPPRAPYYCLREGG
jgi:hypothetical protein